MNKKILIPILSAALLAGCGTDAEVASHNLSQKADKFQIERRIVFYNGITGDYMLSIVGRCSVQPEGRQVSVLCKTGPDQYKKHILGLSDNVTFFAEQLQPATASVYRYKVIFKPSTIVPDVDLETSAS